MGYYYIKLSSGDKQLCTIILLRGKYKYQKRPMGVYNIPDIFQEKIYEIFKGFYMVHVHIENILVITKYDFLEHLKDTDKVL